MTINDPVQQIVLNCLNHFAYQDAIFLSERLHAEFQSEESLYLLALSHYRSGPKPLRAYHILKERHLKLPKSKYLLGKCCFDLNKYGEAESVLTADLTLSSTSQTSSSTTNAPSSSTSSSSTKHKLYDDVIKEYGAEYSSHVLQILANVYCKTDRVWQAVEFYKKSLRLNPFMWSSFDAICNMGEKIEPSKYFTFNSALNAYKSQVLDTNAFIAPQQTPTVIPMQQQEKTQQTNNVLKQIDQQNDFLDHKCKQDIAQILRLVETDQHNKLKTQQHHSLSSKENSISNENDDQQQDPNLNPTTTGQNTCSHCCCCCSSQNRTIPDQNTITEQNNKLKQTPLLNQVLGKTINQHSFESTTSTSTTTTTTLTQSNPSTSSTSLSTPPQVITANTLNLAPQHKKFISKRQMHVHVASKPLFGQNTTNSLANINSGAQKSTHTTAVKENKKTTSTTTDQSSQSSTSSSSSSATGSTTSTTSRPTSSSLKFNKKIKLKKKPDPSTLETQKPVEEVVVDKNEQEDQNQVLDCANSCTNSYNECRHCNLLSNQSKTSSLGSNFFSSTTSYAASLNTGGFSSSSNNNTQIGNNLRKNSFKLNLLIEQSICLDNLMKLLKDMANAYFNLKQFECEKSLSYFEQLPQSQLESSFVLTNMAKAHFELHNYSKAEKIYLKLRREYPYHLEGLQYYSTTLWHLQKEIALSALAQELTEFDKLAPETWCVVGNCFSLHKEHDAAIKFFQRATQVDPKFVYAYNLLGHEYVLIEEMDKGLSCFRKAIFLDPRHYNAWYGISMIHFKQEKFLLAEKYLKKALLINPHSSTLMCHIAVVYHSLKQSEKALQILDRALAIEAKNTLCKFHRASILFSMEKYEEALEEYERLRRIIPKESLIYYMISKTHKKLKNVHLSLMYMSWAMDLDPKGVNNQLKESIDKRYVIDSDSTFARELETINTSTLDAIYGGNELSQNNDNEGEDLEASTNNNNNNENTTNNNNLNNDENNNASNNIPLPEDYAENDEDVIIRDANEANQASDERRRFREENENEYRELEAEEEEDPDQAHNQDQEEQTEAMENENDNENIEKMLLDVNLIRRDNSNQDEDETGFRQRKFKSKHIVEEYDEEDEDDDDEEDEDEDEDDDDQDEDEDNDDDDQDHNNPDDDQDNNANSNNKQNPDFNEDYTNESAQNQPKTGSSASSDNSRKAGSSGAQDSNKNEISEDQDEDEDEDEEPQTVISVNSESQGINRTIQDESKKKSNFLSKYKYRAAKSSKIEKHDNPTTTTSSTLNQNKKSSIKRIDFTSYATTSHTKPVKRTLSLKIDDDSENDADDKIEEDNEPDEDKTDKCTVSNNSTNQILINNFETSTFTPENSNIPIQMPVAPKSSCKFLIRKKEPVANLKSRKLYIVNELNAININNTPDFTTGASGLSSSSMMVFEDQNQEQEHFNRFSLSSSSIGAVMARLMDQEETDDESEEDYEEKYQVLSLNDEHLDDKSVSFISMTSVIDTTKNNETIPFMNQSQMSINLLNKSASLCTQQQQQHQKSQHFNQTSLQDQLMDSIEEDL